MTSNQFLRFLLNIEAESSADDEKVVSETVTSQPDRRLLLRRLVSLAALGGLMGLFINQVGNDKVIPEVHAATVTTPWTGVADGDPIGIGEANAGNNTSSSPTGLSLHYTGTGPSFVVQNDQAADNSVIKGLHTNTSANQNYGIWGEIATPGKTSTFAFNQAAGVYGHATSTSPNLYTAGVLGVSEESSTAKGNGVSGINRGNGYGVYGAAYGGTGVGGVFSGNGYGVMAQASSNSAVPIVAVGAGSQTANLQEWQKGDGTKLSTVAANGYLGIGTGNAAYPLTAIANTAIAAMYLHCSASAPSQIFFDSVAGQQAYLNFGDGGVQKFQVGKQSDNTFFFWDQTNLHDFIYVNPATKVIALDQDSLPYMVGIGTGTPSHLLQLNGGAYSDGSTWNPASSVRWKENIEPLAGGVEMVKQLHPVAYNYKKTPGKKTMGFIAEEVGKVLPTVVDWDKNEEGYAEGYDPIAILALAVEAVKEQERTIDQLQDRIRKLERQFGVG